MEQLILIIVSVLDHGIVISSSYSDSNMSPEMTIVMALGFLSVAVSFVVQIINK